MSKLPKKIKQNEKYPDEDCSVILGNCYDQKTTAKIVKRYNCYDDLLVALEIVQGQLINCCKYFLGTGEQPEPVPMAAATTVGDKAIAKAGKITKGE